MTDEFAHAKGLEAVEVRRRLVSETIRRDIEQPSFIRHRAALRRDGIDRVTGGRREHEVGRGQGLGPVAAVLEAFDGGADVALGAVQRADAAKQIGKALEISRFLQLLAAHHRRKAEHFGPSGDRAAR